MAGTLSYRPVQDGTQLSLLNERNQENIFNHKKKEDTWQKVLQDATLRLPALSFDEHGKASRVLSILFLEFMFPQSKGTHYFALQNISSRNGQRMNQAAGISTKEDGSRNEKDFLYDNILKMDLEERLEYSNQRYDANDYGGPGTVVDERQYLKFVLFLRDGAGKFLRGRPAHPDLADFLHIVAMAIFDRPSGEWMEETVSKLEKEDSAPWKRSKRLMESTHALCFHIGYRLRLEVIRMIANDLMLPEFQEENVKKNAIFFDGALNHLRAALHSFSYTAESDYDAHLARCALTSIAVQTGIDVVVREEWDSLLHLIADDRANYGCSCCFSQRDGRHSFITQDQPDKFCPHVARGQLLGLFLTRFNESRHYADASFLQYALEKLTDAVEWQTDCWTKGTEEGGDESKKGAEGEESKTEKGEQEADDDMGEKKGQPVVNNDTTTDPPCMLAALLYVAKSLFYFLLPIFNADDDGEAEESEESHQRDMLLSCSIQLLHHWNDNIAYEASNLLTLGFSYGAVVVDYAEPIFESTKMAMAKALELDSSAEKDGAGRQNPIEKTVAAFSQMCATFGDALMAFLLSSWSPKNANESSVKVNEHVLFRTISLAATASPITTAKHADTLMAMYEDDRTPTHAKYHLFAALLSCRLSSFFAEHNKIVEDFLLQAISDDMNGWKSYQLVRQAFITGNFKIALKLLEAISYLVWSETSDAMISALSCVADAESTLADNAAQGLPPATIRLRTAKMHLRTLARISGEQKIDVSFQETWISMRLDFLELMIGLRQITREVRITGTGPARNTRSSLHLRNIVRGFDVLAARWLVVYRQYGLFICQQSRTSLRSLHALSRFVADAARSLFGDALPDVGKNIGELAIKSLTLPKGDSVHPSTILIKTLDDLILKEMGNTLDPRLRAAAILELFDGVLKAPVPFPRDFFSLKPIPAASLQLTKDPSFSFFAGKNGDEELSESEGIIEVSTDAAFSFFASGKIPESLVAHANLQFSMALLWYTVSFLKPIPDDEPPSDEKGDGDNTESSEADFSFETINSEPTSSPITASGRFYIRVECPSLANEGFYKIESRVGCRDIRCGEWELPTEDTLPSIIIRVAQKG